MMNPFKEKPMAMEEGFLLEELYPKPYSKTRPIPHKCRVILMNGIETEAVMFGHQFHRNCSDNELRRESRPAAARNKCGRKLLTGCRPAMKRSSRRQSVMNMLP